uniref:Heat shock protein n=1 Tax=Cherax quadricarinatus TaxID=27406 RepID=A0A9E9NJ42_CHEQU|nr:heat shock protein [Cherax quadricarinatus]
MAPVHQNTDASSRLANTLTNISNTSCVNSVKSSSSSSSGTSSSSRLCETNMNQLESTGVREDLLPITCRGSFYHDAFFKEARQHFDEAIKDVLDRWGHRSATMDDLTCYRKLRETNLREDNQAVTVSQNSHHHQVVIDVRDFLSGDVKVKVVDENEVVVEGSVEHTHQGSVSKKSFLRRFSFPGLVRPDAVTSTMSSDGVPYHNCTKEGTCVTHNKS